MPAPTPALVLGAMMFGTAVDEATSFALLDRFVERGGTWIDTANCYSFWASDSGRGGDSERVIGRWLRARPDTAPRVRIATKFGAELKHPGSFPDAEGLSPDVARRAFSESVDRLGVDHVDLLWLHKEDRATPIEATIDAVAEFTRAGSALRVGASNHPAWIVERARAHAHAIDATPIDAVQLSASYLVPRPGIPVEGQDHRFGIMSDEQYDYAVTGGLEVWAYSPLLGGAYDNAEKRFREAYTHIGNDRRRVVLDGIAADRGVGSSQVVLAWLVSRGITPILGGSKIDQLDLAFDAVALELTDGELSALNAAG